MKKIILLLTLILFSCNKDDNSNEEKDVAITPFAIFGYWYNKQDTKLDGTVILNNNECTTKRDALELKSNFTAVEYNYNSNCVNVGLQNLSYSFATANTGENFIDFGGSYDLLEIIKLTNKTMYVEYDFLLQSGLTEKRTRIYTRE